MYREFREFREFKVTFPNLPKLPKLLMSLGYALNKRKERADALRYVLIVAQITSLPKTPRYVLIVVDNKLTRGSTKGLLNLIYLSTHTPHLT